MFQRGFRGDRTIRMHRNQRIPKYPHMMTVLHRRGVLRDDHVCKRWCWVIHIHHMANGKNQWFDIQRVLVYLAL
jgi:hypothetical protein